MHSVLTTLGAVIGLCLCAANAAAQTRAIDDADATHAARTQQRAARDAYERGDYRTAIEGFVAADRLRPRAALSFDVAKAYDGLGDSSRALAAYRQYLRRSARVADLASVRDRIEVLAGKLASRGVQQITVSSSPIGASTFVDGEPIGRAPVSLDLPPGIHEVTLRAPGYPSASTRVDLAVDRPLDVSLDLAAPELASAKQAPTAESRAKLEARTPETHPNTALRVSGFAALGAGVAALGGALSVEVLRRNSNESSKPPTSAEQDSQRTQKALAGVLVGAGGALAAVGGVLLMAAYASPEKKPREGLAVACLPAKCQATFSGAF
jgi:tetratricopeptide (TPR) repeat protein